MARGGERGELSGEEGVVRVGGVYDRWGQWFRGRGCWSSVRGIVRGVVRLVGSIWGR